MPPLAAIASPTSASPRLTGTARAPRREHPIRALGDFDVDAVSLADTEPADGEENVDPSERRRSREARHRGAAFLKVVAGTGCSSTQHCKHEGISDTHLPNEMQILPCPPKTLCRATGTLTLGSYS